VSVKKDSTGKDEVFNVYQEGQNMSGVSNLSKYKTLILRCGFDKRKHGYINPFADLINGGHETVSNVDSRETYLPVPFHPINPYVPDAQYCNIMLKDCGGNNCVMTTEENEYFEENMIVEFVTDDESKSGFWRWIPIRVRHDKTSELRSGVKITATHTTSQQQLDVYTQPDYGGNDYDWRQNTVDAYRQRRVLQQDEQGYRNPVFARFPQSLREA
jgi:hypothetical protein